MRREDFENELQRLANGFAEILTPERAQAFWDQFGEAKAPLLHEAVTQLLCDRRFPNNEEFLEALRRAAKQTAHVEEPWRCGWRTHGRRCPLHWTWKQDGARFGLCPWHMRQETLGLTDDADLYQAFLDWCEEVQRWPICEDDPAKLWRIVCGLDDAKGLPRQTWTTG